VAFTVQLEDHTGNTSRQAKMSETATVARLIPAIVTQMELPITDPSGRPVAYHLSYNNRQLVDDDTLTTAGVQDGGTLTIVPEMTAGSRAGLGAWLNNFQPPVLTLGEVVRERRPLKGFPSFAVAPPDAGQVSVYVWQQALTEMSQHASSHSEREVGGILTGEVYEEDGKYMVVIEGVCQAHHVLASCASLQFTADTWMDILKERSTCPEKKTLGWYHSHPGIGVFLSGIDQFTHQSFFGNRPWYVALVIDPVSGDLGAFTWEDGRLSRYPQIVIL
jgi:proteasome lid subunit RPN8/RPN11